MCLQESRIVGKILADSRLHRAFRIELWRWFMCNLTACRAVESWTLSRSGKPVKFNQAPLHHPLHQTGRLNYHPDFCVLTYILSFFFNINSWPLLKLTMHGILVKSLWHGSLHNSRCLCTHGTETHISVGSNTHLEAVSGSETCLPDVHYYLIVLLIWQSHQSWWVVCGCLLQSCFYFTQLFPYHEAQIWGWGEVVMAAISSLLRSNSFFKISICWDSFGVWNFCLLSLGGPGPLCWHWKASACTLPASSGSEEQSCKLNTPSVSQPIPHRKELKVPRVECC